MTERMTGKSLGALIPGAALLCALAAAPWSLAAQQLPAQPNAIRQQLAQAGQPSPANASVPQGAPKPATSAPKPASQKAPAPKPASKAAAKPAATKVADKKPVETAAKPDAQHEAARRDPFSPLISGGDKGSTIPEHLPPGKAGLVISLLRVDGIVKGPNGMIAVVSNQQQRTYFLREGDQLYDGAVEKITMTDVSFHESGKDPFGKPVEREVSKPLNATPGEQQ